MFKYSNSFPLSSKRGAYFLKEDKTKKISYTTLIKNKTLSQFGCDKKGKDVMA